MPRSLRDIAGRVGNAPQVTETPAQQASLGWLHGKPCSVNRSTLIATAGLLRAVPPGKRICLAHSLKRGRLSAGTGSLFARRRGQIGMTVYAQSQPFSSVVWQS